jgi:hypothetical protein
MADNYRDTGMNTLIPTIAEKSPPQLNERQRVLELAGKLNRIGRKSERFLSMQLQQLELAMVDFERERAAWRRQQQRETQQLEQLRDQLLKQRQHAACSTETAPPPDRAAQQDLPITHAALATGSAPLRVLLQPGSASRMQIGLLMFEASKLNREMGGEGVRFEIKDCRSCPDNHSPDQPQRKNRDRTTLLEFEAFSHARLIGSRSEVRVWEAYKSSLLMSSLSNSGLDIDFKSGTPAPRRDTVRELGTDAAHRAFEANSKCFDEDRVHGPAFRAKGGAGAIQQQLNRLESLVGLLKRDHGLLIHVSLV